MVIGRRYQPRAPEIELLRIILFRHTDDKPAEGSFQGVDGQGLAQLFAAQGDFDGIGEVVLDQHLVDQTLVFDPQPPAALQHGRIDPFGDVAVRLQEPGDKRFCLRRGEALAFLR